MWFMCWGETEREREKEEEEGAEGQKEKSMGQYWQVGDRAASATSHHVSGSYLTAAGSLMWHGGDSRATPGRARGRNGQVNRAGVRPKKKTYLSDKWNIIVVRLELVK